MKKFFSYSIAALIGFVFIMAITPGLDGRWTGTIHVPDGNQVDVVYNFKTSGDTLTGTAESPEGVVSIDSGKVAGNTFSFQVTVDGNVYPHKGTQYGDSCGVDIDFGSQIVHTTIVRDTTAVKQ